MSLFGILLILAVITAIPTFGLSFVALFFAKKWINANEGKKIAAAAINAKIDDKIVAIPFVSYAGAKSFFNSYGTSEKKYHYFDKPFNAVLGYVTVEDDSEYVVMVNSSGKMSYISTFIPPTRFGNDLLSLMRKQEFLESIVASMNS